jgi:ABC-type dipeptide/oligopeptide/nickel transport system ATPase component
LGHSRQARLTYLFISHNRAVVRHMASRIGVLYLGRLVEAALARDLFRAPRHPYTRMLLDAVPDLGAGGLCLASALPARQRALARQAVPADGDANGRGGIVVAEGRI